MSYILPFWGKARTRQNCQQYESYGNIVAALRKSAYGTENAVYHCFYVLYYAKARAFVLGNGGSEAVADDVFQDAMAAILVKMRRKDKALVLHQDAFGPYLIKIVTNTWYSRFRVKSAGELVTDFTSESLPHDSEDLRDLLDAIEDAQLLHEAIAALPEKQRTFVQLYYIEGKSYDEIAKLTGQSAEALKANRHRIINRLREILRQLR